MSLNTDLTYATTRCTRINRAMLQQAWRGIVSDSWTSLSTYSTTVTLRDTQLLLQAFRTSVRVSICNRGGSRPGDQGRGETPYHCSSIPFLPLSSRSGSGWARPW